MASALDTLLTSEVAPPMRAAGYKRKGRRFILENDRGDRAFIEVSTSGRLVLGDGYRHFWVRPWMMPEPFTDKWRARTVGDPLSAGDGLPLWDVRPPAAFVSRWGDDVWAVPEGDPDQVAECGRAVAQALVPSVVEQQRRLLDRATLLQETRRADARPRPDRQESPLGLWRGFGGEVLTLLADAGDTAGVAELLEDGETNWLVLRDQGSRFATDLLSWVDRRLEVRGAPSLTDYLP